jgi:hypothetical protein
MTPYRVWHLMTPYWVYSSLQEPLSVPVWAVFFTLLAVANRQFGFVDARAAAFAVMVVMVIGYLNYVTDVIQALCEHLKIKVFTIEVHAP